MPVRKKPDPHAYDLQVWPRMMGVVVDPLQLLIYRLWVGEISLPQAIDEIKRLLMAQKLDDKLMLKSKLDEAFNFICCEMDIRTMPSPQDITKLRKLLGIKDSLQVMNNVTEGVLDEGITMSCDLPGAPHDEEETMSLSNLQALTKGSLNQPVKGGEQKEDELYAVEAIRGKRVRKGKPQYLINWKGYPDKDSTWEPVSNLYLCQNLIQAFENGPNKKRKHS